MPDSSNNPYLSFTIFENVWETKGKRISKPWHNWIADWIVHAVRGDSSHSDSKELLNQLKNGTCVVFGSLGQNLARNAENMRSVHALSLDLDKHPEEAVEALLVRLEKYEYFAWTTHKHGSVVAAGCPRLRVVFPLKTPIAPEQFSDAWSLLDSYCSKMNDPHTKDICRLNFLPSTFDITLAWNHHNKGEFLSFEELKSLVVAEKVVKSVENRSINKIVSKLSKLSVGNPLKQVVKLLLSGLSFADPGESHQKTLELTFLIAQKSLLLLRSDIEILFGNSISVMQIGGSSITHVEVWNGYSGARDKILKSREIVQKERVVQISGKAPYSDDEISNIAKLNSCSVKELKNRWVLQKAGCGWIMGPEGDYLGPYAKEDFPIMIRRHLSRAPVQLTVLDSETIKYRPIDMVVLESGDIINKIISDMNTQRTSYDPETRTLYEAIMPLRKLEPEFDPDIDNWLKELGGIEYLKLVDWISCVPDLSKLLCALYLKGPASSGKTLMAYGLARLWTEGSPADVGTVLSSFNDGLAVCPLILGDEELPKSSKQSITAVLRTMLSTDSRPFRRKHIATSNLVGNIRLILAANNDSLLQNKQANTAQDLDAIAQRFLYIEVSQKATDYLITQSRETKSMWGKEGIAKHALWLSENHEVENPGDRFWVEGSVTTMHKMLMTDSKWNSFVCEWLVRYLLNPGGYDSRKTGLVLRKDGELFVNNQALVDGWTLYLKTRIDPDTAKISTALTSLAKDDVTHRKLYNKKRIRYRKIEISFLLSWAKRHNIGDKESLLDSLK